MMRSPSRRARRVLLAFCAFALLTGQSGCGTSAPVASLTPPRPASEPLRAMSFNIRYGTAADGENAWPQRRGLVFRVIDDHAPAVLGVQEALRFQLDEIAAALPQYGAIGVGREADGGGEYSAILYDRQRLEPLATGTFWLSDTPHVPGSKSWGNNLPRIATWARFRDRLTEATFYVFNTHWDHESQPARERSAALVRERIAARTVRDPVLLMGDFNSGEDNPAFRALLVERAGGSDALRLYDTFRAVQPEAREVGTYHAFTGERTGARIDAILASPEWRTRIAAILTFSEGARFPSDHFPVLATLELLATGAP